MSSHEQTNSITKHANIEWLANLRARNVELETKLAQANADNSSLEEMLNDHQAALIHLTMLRRNIEYVDNSPPPPEWQEEYTTNAPIVVDMLRERLENEYTTLTKKIVDQLDGMCHCFRCAHHGICHEPVD